MMPDLFYSVAFHLLCVLSLGGASLALFRVHRIENRMLNLATEKGRKRTR